MNRRVQSGAFALAVSLAIVGTASSAGFSDYETPSGKLKVTQPSEGSEPFSTVPIRSGNPEDVIEETSPRPKTIRVAEIGLEAQVIPVGVDAKNELDVPSAEKVGWYQYSSTPGSQGASVLAAHVDYGGKQGAFFNLNKLQIGKKFEIELEDGTVQKYKVSGNTTYDKINLPDAEVFRKDGKPVIQLVTCGGSFDPEERSYRANVVVSAVPV